MPAPDQTRTVQVQGLAQLRAELKAAAGRSPSEIAKANWAAADTVATKVEQLAPRGKHQGSDPGGRGGFVPIHQAIRRYGTPTRASVGIGGQATPHGQVKEFGGTIPRRAPRAERAIQRRQVAYAKRAHRSFTSAGVRTVTKVAAHPHLYKGIRQTADTVMDDYVAALNRIVRGPFPDGTL